MIEADDLQLVATWMSWWRDLASVDVHDVVTSAEAAKAIEPQL